MDKSSSRSEYYIQGPSVVGRWPGIANEDEWVRDDASKAFDGPMKRCPNWKFCQQTHPFGYLDCHGGRCRSCNMHFYMSLTFVDGDSIECPRCKTETKDAMVFPGCPEEHTFCVDCVRKKFTSPVTDLIWAVNDDDDGSCELMCMHATPPCGYCRRVDELDFWDYWDGGACFTCKHKHVPGYGKRRKTEK